MSVPDAALHGGDVESLFAAVIASLRLHPTTPSGTTLIVAATNDVDDIMLANIAADRGVTPQAARAAVEATPFTGARAVELKLIDQLGRPEDAERAALARVEHSELVELGDYHAPTHSGGRVIAVVQGEGPIVSGPDEDDIFGGIGDDDFCWETLDLLDDLPAMSPADFNATNMGTDDRFGPM